MFKGSAEQNAIINEIVNGVHHVTVNAGPGSGKTATALEAMKHLPSNAKIAFVCFNSKIKEENATKAPKHVHVQTLNGFGFCILLKALKLKGFQRVNEYKVQNALQSHLGIKWDKNKDGGPGFVFPSVEVEKLYGKVSAPVKSLCELARCSAVFEAKQNKLQEIVDQYQIDIRVKDEEFWPVALAVYHMIINDTKTFDWTDQIYLPMKNNWTVPTFDYVFVDEAQDLNKIQLMMVLRMSGETGDI